MVHIFSFAILVTLDLGIAAVFIENKTDSDTLVLLHVLFRHGDRTTDLETVYPNDPYINETYYPVGFGQLTTQGKRRSYLIGQTLRKRYNNFLGNQYSPGILEATSTDYDRTKASMELVLASLYPPNPNEAFISDFTWQPIPFNYSDGNSDKNILSDPRDYCKTYQKLYRTQLRSKEVEEISKNHAELFEYLTFKTGRSIEFPNDVLNLFFNLKSEEDWGFRLPEWVKVLWPSRITEVGVTEYAIGTATPEMKRLSGGFLLQKILNDTFSKLYGGTNPRKIHLYSAHENNVAYMLRILGLFEPHVPSFGAYIIWEIHNVDGEYGIKIFYQDYKDENPRLLQIPNCRTLCPLKTLTHLVKAYLPLEQSTCNDV